VFFFIETHFPLSVRDPSLTMTQFCALLKTALFWRAHETLA